MLRRSQANSCSVASIAIAAFRARNVFIVNACSLNIGPALHNWIRCLHVETLQVTQRVQALVGVGAGHTHGAIIGMHARRPQHARVTVPHCLQRLSAVTTNVRNVLQVLVHTHRRASPRPSARSRAQAGSLELRVRSLACSVVERRGTKNIDGGLQRRVQVGGILVDVLN